MFCPKCGAEALDGAAFCQKCGARLAPGDAARPASAPGPGGQTPPAGNIPPDAPKKKKSRNRPLILAAAGLILVFILIAANSGDLAKRGEQAREDEEYIASQQALAAEGDTAAASTSTTASASTSSPSSADEAKERIEQWFDAKVMGYDYAVEYDESIPTDAYGSYVFNFYIGEAYYGTIYAAVDTGELTIYVEGSDGSVSLDEWYQKTWFPYLTGDGSGYAGASAPAPQIDTALCGRWRAADGTSLILDEYGGAQTSINTRPTWALGRAESISWEASNGQLKLTTHYAGDFDYRYSAKNPDDEYSNDKIGVGGGTFRRHKGTVGSDIIGEWEDNYKAEGTDPYFVFYPDGTGLWATDIPMTWTISDEKLYMYYDLFGTNDYYVVGDSLELFFSDGSKMFTRVGN